MAGRATVWVVRARRGARRPEVGLEDKGSMSSESMPSYRWIAAFVVCALAAGTAGVGVGCGESFEQERAPRDRINYPVGMTMHPDGRYLYVVNSNFTAKYEADMGGTVSVIDTQTLKIDASSTPFVPSFGAEIELNGDATRAYVTLREGDAVAGLAVTSDDSGNPGSRLGCRKDGEIVTSPESCVFDKVPPTDNGAPFFIDPFGLNVSTIYREHPETGESTAIDLLNISYLSTQRGGGRVSAVSLPGRSLQNGSIKTAGLISGNRVARRPGTMNFYVAGRTSNGLLVYSPYLNLQDAGSFGKVQGIVQKGGVALTRETGTTDARGLAFSEDGSRLYAVTRQPDAMHVLEITSEDRATGEGTRREVVGTIPLPDGPSSVMLRKMSDGSRLAYVPCYGANTIHVVDPAAETVVDTIEVDASPYNIVMDTADDRCTGPGTTCRAYVTLFDDTPRRYDECQTDATACGSVAVVDLDPASTRYHQVISKIR